MLPSILAHELSESTRRFLITAFEPADAYFGGIVRRFVDTPGAIGKGPYLQLGLPFRAGTGARAFFPRFETEHPGFSHQEHAWRRLRSDAAPSNTLVVTGTGSGKTECFLYPVLDHCARQKEQGAARGIKALVIYPMNALANDQARRFAEVVARTPAFAGLRVGMYIGGGGQGSAVMTPTTVITDRDTLRKAPPDVLLTNYKMLDYLLVRPKDRSLWAHNAPDTLRYVVVDELHTFDGAQGTDLALLLRRLRARLGTPPEHVVCVGTSATLGDGDTAPLRTYAGQVFASAFEVESVVAEDRDSVAQFLGEAPINHLLQSRDDFAEILDAQRYRSQAEAIAAWFPVFFAGEAVPTDVSDPAWRCALGRLLKQHLLVHNLLRVLKGGIGEWSVLCEQLTGPMPAAARPHAPRVLDALVALLAWARDVKDPNLPLVTVRVQLWMRELRRLVASVVPLATGGDNAPVDLPALRTAADLKAAREGLHLPLVQCIECHTTAWVGLRQSGSVKVDSVLEAIYNAWFRSAPELVRLYGDATLDLPCQRYLCGACGRLNDSPGTCADCRHLGLVPVFELQDYQQSKRGDVTYNWHDKTCPACGAHDRLLLLGARNATLGAQLIEQGWATPYNDDKKLIAFSDSVQDAAHRAGFFGSRTYRNNIRMAIARVVDALAQPSVPWTSLLDQLPTWLLDPARLGHLTPEAFVSEFIGPDMLWQHPWEALQRDGSLPAGSKLLARVRKRLAWEAVAEFTYLSRRGRTLDRLAFATLTLPADALEPSVDAVHRRLVEAFGLREVTRDQVRHWLWGIVLHLRQRGAITHDEMKGYALSGWLGTLTFDRGRRDWLPPIGPFSHHPQLLTLGKHRDFEVLIDRGRSWYEQWLRVTIGHGLLLPKGSERELYETALSELIAADVLQPFDGRDGRAIALRAERLEVDRDAVQLGASSGTRELTVSRALAPVVLGMPCLDAMHERYTGIVEPDDAEMWMVRRYRHGDIRRVIAAEHTGLLERDEREALEDRFKAKPSDAKPWYENLLSATPTLEMGVDIGSLSSLLLCSVPPSQASFLQRVGRAGRRDGNAIVVTLADGASPHDLYFYEEPFEMMAGEVAPPGTFLQAPEVLRRQLLAFCLDTWVASGIAATAFPDKTKPALDAVERKDEARFPYNFLNFVQNDEHGLLDRFVALLDYQPQDEVERRGVVRVLNRLREYMFGEGGVDALRVGLLKVLEELRRERHAYLERARDIKKEIERLKQQPKDEARDAQLRDHIRERGKLLELAKGISDRDLLNTFTDAGLLPNYAFPEAGVELKSLLWRRRHADDEPGGGLYVTITQRFERPAASALSEFAPENRFYANQRRVQIDQINMQLAKTEDWRLCPSCHHLENVLVSGDAHPACPRCGSAMWGDIQQRRTLLRFRQAVANANDEKSRIDDRSDDREPRFFIRQLLVDFDPNDVVVAWRLQDEHLAFGFESIRRAQFRDINFGEMGRQGVSFSVADWETTRPGFKVCRHCGMVQTPPPRRRPGEKPGPVQKHARDCQWWGKDLPEAVLDCLYLYREFSSEAVRILVPYTRTGLNETVLQSFMAALQLGLKRHYGGKVDHLRITTQEEPGADQGPKRHYVLLYDSVPGGTGYLHQLLSEDAQTLTQVLQKAYATLRACPCNAVPEKDGCYRCLYQYRQGRALSKVSRRAAEDLLGELLGSIEHLERVKSLSEIHINAQLDSILEGQFIECLSRIGGTAGLPKIKVTQDIVQGRTGYLLEVGAERYWVRLQVDVGPDDGVGAFVRPDFVIQPVRGTSTRRPIAVFADGWAYHRGAVRADAQKRSALVASEKYWVWSVVWEDVQAALAGNVEATQDVMAAHARLGVSDPLVVKVRSSLGRGSGTISEHAVARLVRWLSDPADDPDDGALRRRQREAAVLAARLIVHPQSPDIPAARGALQAVAAALPDGHHEAPLDAAVGWSKEPLRAAVVRLAWPQAYMRGDFSAGFGAITLAPAQAPTPEALKASWREWLELFNELQVLPGTFLMEQVGIEHGDYGGLAPAAVSSSVPVPADETDGEARAWDVAIGQAVGEMHEGMRALAARGVPAPDAVGVELASTSGGVIAEAELQWEQPHLVVLAPHQAEQVEACKAAGWQVVLAVDSGWADTVALAIIEVADV